MRIAKRHPYLLGIAAILVLEVGGLTVAYFNLSPDDRFGYQLNPWWFTAMAMIKAYLAFAAMVLLVTAVTIDLRAHFPYALGVVMIGLVVGTALLPGMLGSGCGCEPS